MTAYEVSFPEDNAAVDQDGEYCTVATATGERRIRFHDYEQIYALPGLYEQLFYTELRCQSPTVVCRRLAERLADAGVAPRDLRVLDLGAGNGMVGERLRALGVERIVGADILPEAAEAAVRDREGVYEDYVVADITVPGAGDRALLESKGFNCLTTVAALGFGDVPPEAFAAALDLVDIDGWVAMSIKEDFLTDADGSGFAQLVRSAVESGALELLDRHSYRHRLSAAGEELHYAAVIARKRAPLEL